MRAGVLGPDHPELATTLVNLGMLERARGRHAAADQALRRAVALLEPAVPPDHPTLVAALLELRAQAATRPGPSRSVGHTKPRNCSRRPRPVR
jgi:Tfp pilus assembly protein PilF